VVATSPLQLEQIVISQPGQRGQGFQTAFPVVQEGEQTRMLDDPAFGKQRRQDSA